MSSDSGVACECTECGKPNWYDNGKCQGCHSDSDIDFTWIAKTTKGGALCAAPADAFRLDAGASAQLIEIWKALLLVRSLAPHLEQSEHSNDAHPQTSSSSEVVSYHSAEWYQQRGRCFRVRVGRQQIDSGFTDDLNRASDWTNRSFVVRAVVTFEAFAVEGKGPKGFRLPNRPGMREYHHARRLRNDIAHGNPLTGPRLVAEAKRLFGCNALDGNACRLDIDKVLEPLWARLLVYAGFLESGRAVPPNPAVVVASDGASCLIQTFSGLKKVSNGGSSHSIGDIIPAPKTV